MKKKIMVISCIIVILVIIVPIFLDYCILGNRVNSNIGNDIWMSFFGSYFGGLFGAIATLMVLCDTWNSRKKEEQKNKKEQEEQRKLSIMPCLQSREKMVENEEQLRNGNNVYFVLYEQGNIKQTREMPRKIEYGFSKYFIIEVELRNVGVGSAISLNAFIDGKQILFNDSLGIGQVLKCYYIFDIEELYHKETQVTFEYSDIMGLVRYRQEEAYLIYRDEKELLWKNSQYLTLPQKI
ncbi:MAG: hypothetical protein NC124_08605 [Clostridium sp.]|nr:hypothetical protein [Clostridium sp.]